ncbi:sigma-70 family RNA polymerase sigma factor [Microbacterium sp. 77mftsu3.1]|uniref:sigma-70 family RNA polymerase sigma factor n=1 Tax=Microbacterium sp. 77mftsu3.1 TaxID=1761802 RepID=UPI000373AC19|nr:sigma-70 family RNA polymerase sigma factor [Microbacterium sp. 77mftsu3.1]SDH36858.1 RNA polymerase sigma factor for flagellar operon FliA [Microbacterium sp. 77mftsu3.1]
MPDLVERNQLIEANLPLVGYIARKEHAAANHLPLEDLAGAGALALVKAADTFDPSRGVPFGAYARQLITFAIKEEMRSMDWATRGVRQRIKKVTEMREQLSASLGRTVTAEEISDTLGMALDEVQDALQSTSKVIDLEGSAAYQVHAVVALPEESAVMSDRRDVLQRALDALPERMRVIVQGVYIEERPVKDIAEELGVTHGAISQQRGEAIRLLRDAMEKFHLDSDAEPTSTLSPATRRDYLARVAKSRYASAD